MISSPNLFKPFKTKRAFEEISNQIKELIYSGIFKPGDKLPSERELASQFKTGRLVVREALRTLEHSGLVLIKQGSSGGAFIKNLDTTPIIRSLSDMVKIGSITLQNLTDARLGIEILILQSASEKLTNEDLLLLKKNVEDAEQKVSSGVRILNENIEFHILLAKSTKNPLFETIIRSIMEVTKSFMISYNPGIEYVNRVLEYHKEIYELLKEKNFIKAKDKMHEHLLDINKKVLALAESDVKTKFHSKEIS